MCVNRNTIRECVKRVRYQEQSAFITNNPYKKTTKQTEYSNYKENQKNTNEYQKKAIFHIKQHKTKYPNAKIKGLSLKLGYNQLNIIIVFLF